MFREELIAAVISIIYKGRWFFLKKKYCGIKGCDNGECNRISQLAHIAIVRSVKYLYFSPKKRTDMIIHEKRTCE